MIKKLVAILGVIMIGFFFGYQGYRIAYAHIIPGVDRPFDPGAYYSSTEISYRDSPSPFFFRDLAANGGTVLDTMRKAKSVLFSGDFTNLASIFTSKTRNDEINTSPFSADVLKKTSMNVSAIQGNTSKIAQSSNSLEIREGELFRRPDRYDESTNSYDEKAQLSWLEKTYSSFVQAAKDSLADSARQGEALNTIMENAYNANGDLQASQASAELDAFNQAMNARRNNLLANYAALKAAHNMKQEDEELRGIREIDKVSTRISDPYKPTAEDEKVFTRPSAPGFKDF